MLCGLKVKSQGHKVDMSYILVDEKCSNVADRQWHNFRDICSSMATVSKSLTTNCTVLIILLRPASVISANGKGNIC